MQMKIDHDIVATARSVYSDVQAIYRFGSWGTPHQHPESDLDVAVLLPHETATSIAIQDWIRLNGKLSYAARIDRVDLVNLRTADTTLQAEILSKGDLLYSSDENARLAFESLVLAMHQELIAWRKEAEHCSPSDSNNE